MANWCFNSLIITGPADEIKRFKEGIQRMVDDSKLVNGSYRILQSYIPCPQELMDTNYFMRKDMGYDACFNPEPEGYLRVLKCPEIQKHGIKTRTELIELIKREYPKKYENGLKINNNLFEFGYGYWHDWCMANWGTQWEEYQNWLRREATNVLIFEFDTAWCPPWRGYDKISALFPELDFTLNYEELMMSLQGYIRWTHGEMVEWCDEFPMEESVDAPDFSLDELMKGTSIYGNS